jgi:hypothetical protein
MTIIASRWIGSNIREHLVYDGTSYLGIFLVDLEDKVAPEKRLLVLDISLKSSPSRWWATHKGTLSSWDEAKHAIQYHFIPPSQGTHPNKDHKPNS